jgi:hypothetical protein
MNQYLEEKSTDRGFDWADTEIFNDPLCEEARQTRIRSFGNSWPFDSLDGAKPISSKMVDAGFYHSLQEEDDDLAMCIYCGISLEGWEPEDDPLVEHKKRAQEQDCYYLNALLALDSAVPLKTMKRKSSSLEVKPKKGKISKTEVNISVSSQDSSGFLTRPRSQRKAAQNLYLNEDLSESEENEENEVQEASTSHDDESFGISAHEVDLNSEGTQYESSQKSQRRKRAASVTLKNSSKLNTSKASVSPIKKSKILDSSFDSDDLFSKKNIQRADISSLSPVKPIIQLREPTPLNNVTNTFEQHLKTQKEELPVEKVSTHSIDESDDDQVFHSGSNGSFETSAGDKLNVALTSKEHENSIEKPVSAHHNRNEIKENTLPNVEEEDTDDNDSIILISNSKEIILDSLAEDGTSPTGHSSSSSVQRLQKSSPLKRLQTGSSPSQPQISQEHIKSFELKNSSVSRIDDHPSIHSNKSVLAQPRFGSPGIKRSRSPFLDDDYKGSDDITEPELGIKMDDDPIEESTDHNIGAQIKQIHTEKSTNTSVSSLKSHNATQGVHDEKAEMLESSSNETFHSVDEGDEEETPSKPQLVINAGEEEEEEDQKVDQWKKTDPDMIFTKYEDLQTAKDYLFEISKIPYELSDDIDGRVSYFINEMPENELDMTIEEWVAHTAHQGKSHFEDLCLNMLKEYDSECARALQVLKNLPVISSDK